MSEVNKKKIKDLTWQHLTGYWAVARSCYSLIETRNMQLYIRTKGSFSPAFGFARWSWSYAGIEIPYPALFPLPISHPNPIKTRNPAPTSNQNSHFPPLFSAQIPNITAKKTQIPHPAKPIGDPQSRAESFLQIKSRRKEQHSKLAVNKLNRAKLLDFLVPLLARENRDLPSSGWKLQQQTKLIQASPVFFGVPKQRPETTCSFVASPMTGYKDKKRSLIGQVSTDEFGANWFLKMKPRLWLAYFMKGMLFGCEQPFLWGERCVTSQKTAAEETKDRGQKFYFCRLP